MGEPIHLRKGNDTMTVYGRAQAAVHTAQGWQLADEAINLPTPPAPVVEPEPEAKAKPKARRKPAAKKGK